MSNVELDLQAPRESSCPPEQSPRLSPTARGMKKAEQTLDIQTVGSDMIGIVLQYSSFQKKFIKQENWNN